jgi:hypothetical protein
MTELPFLKVKNHFEAQRKMSNKITRNPFSTGRTVREARPLRFHPGEALQNFRSTGMRILSQNPEKMRSTMDGGFGDRFLSSIFYLGICPHLTVRAICYKKNSPISEN